MPPLFGRLIWYRDNQGNQREVRIESTNQEELDRVEALYRGLEEGSHNGERSWQSNHTTFTDADIKPDRIDRSVMAKDNPNNPNGFPWEGPYFEFAYLLGESFVWSGPDSLWRTPDGGETWVCRCCGHLRELPVTAACLNADCSRTGRDLAIPRVTVYDLKRREEPKPTPTKLPDARKDRAGRELAGGIGRRRAKATG